MMRLATSFLFLGLLLPSSVLADDPYGPFIFDGGKIQCNDDRGPEIKRTQVYSAPSDRFFKEASISVRETSAAGKGHSCSVIDVKKKTIKVKTDVGEIEVPVIYQFSLYAHADCGSGLANNPPGGGKTAWVECEVSATLVKYTNK